MGQTPEVNAIFESIYIDFIGPYPASRHKRNKYCLVVVDQLSNWVEIFPMTTETSKKVCDVLENEIFCRFGAPSTVITDNGSHFINKNMKKLCKEWSVRHAQLSAYHPNPNRAERTNQDLVRMIASYIEGGHTSWDLHLQKFALVLRNMVNDTTKVSPAILNLGRPIKLPIDRALQADFSDISKIDVQKLARELPESLSQVISFVKNNVRQVHDKNKSYFDIKRRDFQFQVGQKVWAKNHQLPDADRNISKKCLAKWIGPFEIIKKDFDTYILAVDSKLNPKRHISDLKPFFERKTHFSDPISLRKCQKDLEPVIPIQRQLRARKGINYRDLVRTNKKH
jgi:hypothetical protein